jgi:hypothetical protein
MGEVTDHVETDGVGERLEQFGDARHGTWGQLAAVVGDPLRDLRHPWHCLTPIELIRYDPDRTIPQRRT